MCATAETVYGPLLPFEIGDLRPQPAFSLPDAPHCLRMASTFCLQRIAYACHGTQAVELCSMPSRPRSQFSMHT